MGGGQLADNLASQTEQGCAESCRARFPGACRAAEWYEGSKLCYHLDIIAVNLEDKIEDATAATLVMNIC